MISKLLCVILVAVRGPRPPRDLRCLESMVTSSVNYIKRWMALV